MTLWKVWPPEQGERGVRWIRGQAFSLGAAMGHAAVLFLLMALGPAWMASGPAAGDRVASCGRGGTPVS